MRVCVNRPSTRCGAASHPEPSWREAAAVRGLAVVRAGVRRWLRCAVRVLDAPGLVVRSPSAAGQWPRSCVCRRGRGATLRVSLLPAGPPGLAHLASRSPGLAHLGVVARVSEAARGAAPGVFKPMLVPHLPTLTIGQSQLHGHPDPRRRPVSGRPVAMA